MTRVSKSWANNIKQKSPCRHSHISLRPTKQKTK